MKVFISQPMKEKSNDEIKQEREKIVEALKNTFYEDIEILDSFFENAPHDAKPLWYLGEALKLLSTADIAVFAKGWHEARGCKIEHLCAEEYGVQIVKLDY